MQILSVTLQNFKAHRDRFIAFQPGTNAICGENGAGKTSILEAIAWTLFNHRGNYRTEDLIRNGTGSAQARVAFISSRDGRTYEVERCTSKGYTLYDPQLGQRLEYHKIEEDVLPWLREHMGVAPGTDLARLFANTIGVPQGTFTADFLKAPEDRKKVFDSILKVEEYKQVNQEMLSLEKYARARVDELEQAIARYDTELQALEPIQTRVTTLREELAANEATLAQLQAELAGLRQQHDHLSAQAAQVQALVAQQQQMAAQMEGKRQAIALLETAVKDTKLRIQQCEASRADYLAYGELQQTIQHLDQQLQERSKIQRQRDSFQKQLATQNAEIARLASRMEQLARYAEELETLQPYVAQQTRLEQQQEALAVALQEVGAARAEMDALTRQLTKLQNQQKRLSQDVGRLQTLAPQVQRIAGLEQRRDRLQSQLSRIEAARQFEAELRQLVMEGEGRRDRHQIQVKQAQAILKQIQQSVPLLSSASVESALEAVQAGVELNTELLDTLHEILVDLAQQINVEHLNHELHSLGQQITIARQQAADYSTLPQKSSDLVQLTQEVGHLKNQLEGLQASLEEEKMLQGQQAQLVANLKQLNNPRGRCSLLADELKQQSMLKTQQAIATEKITSLSTALTELESQLQRFTDLEQHLTQQRAKLQKHQEGYLAYRQNEPAIAQLPHQEADLQNAIATLQTLEVHYAELKQESDRLAVGFDPLALKTVEALYAETQRKADQISGALPPQRTLIAELEDQLKKLQEIQARRDLTRKDLKQREQNHKFIRFARKAYKEAGPRITERYLQSISREADRLFRELLNRPNVALEWTREYEIRVQEAQHTRRFTNLSGGEQMCAALAVRLALLRVLADIDVAFFDEPTTNMDRQRRVSLAEAIANIKSFQQIFVISHDDTFESVTENVIVLKREAS
ncbi:MULTISPECIES: SMC family ATPase [unclassified Leptolyngbya]|uniref:AAA family ATPase n=1 Tax=unclassified Leptolyngbya TaxID=2650499 RepID=UPI001685E451|nr:MULTISPECIES: SMC family ATPase [unclassified Leptolyngbya]MBD1909531.1 SMC family ATPase [Leptolyngbya sp. FACHB-8]MBD2154623.1 SMC family ATPase [Leptolyngbya sp. FACHB-16]